MFKCRSIQSRLSAFVDNELTVSERKIVESHVAICCNCQEELKSLGATKELLVRLGGSNCTRIKALLETSMAQSAPDLCCKPFRFRTFAAGILAITALVCFVDPLGGNDNHAGPPIAEASILLRARQSPHLLEHDYLMVEPLSAVAGAPETVPGNSDNPQCGGLPLSRGTENRYSSYNQDNNTTFTSYR